MSRRCPDELQPITGWSGLWRSAFETEHAGSTWTVDVDYLDFGERVGLYRDGHLVEEKASPARFVLPGGAHVDAALSLLGMRRVHLVTDGGEGLLSPLPGTGEAWRARLAQHHPRAGAVLDVTSWAVLVAGLLAQLPGLLARLDRIIGVDLPTVSALDPPGALGAALSGAALIAALDRALALRHSRWLDD